QTGPYQVAYAICQRVGGQPLSPEIGDAWFEARGQSGGRAVNARPNGLADIVAVWATWTRIKAVEAAMRAALTPLVTHLSVQLAHATGSGAALEVQWQAEGDVVRYQEITEASLAACLTAGGTIVHHYGVGDLRRAAFAHARGP